MPVLRRRAVRALDLCLALNATRDLGPAALLRALLPHAGDGLVVQSPFSCDYGFNIRLGRHCYFNFNCTVLTCARSASATTASSAPACRSSRRRLLSTRRPGDPAAWRHGEHGRPVGIGDDVWLDGGALVLAGVRIGAGTRSPAPLASGILRLRHRRGFPMSDACCGKAPDVAALHAGQRRVLRIVLAINALTFAMMLAASLYSGATSLLSASLDNLGDASTYALSLMVVGASARAKARVAVFKGLLILGAALAVGVQIALRVADPGVPVFEAMGVAALLNLGANALCLRLLMPYRHGDVNMASAWECSHNDILEGLAVVLAAGLVWAFGAGWPDLLVASALLLLFLRSAWRVLRSAVAELRRQG